MRKLAYTALLLIPSCTYTSSEMHHSPLKTYSNTELVQSTSLPDFFETYNLHAQHKINNSAFPKSLENKTIVLDFWATWCGPCIEKLPEMEKLWNEHGNLQKNNK